MKTPPLALSIPLTTLFVDHYAPVRHRGKTYQCRQRYFTAINWLRKYLGREPTIGDLSTETIEGVKSLISAAGRKPWTVRTSGCVLLSFWRFCGDLGIVSNAPRRQIAYAPRGPYKPRCGPSKPRSPNLSGDGQPVKWCARTGSVPKSFREPRLIVEWAAEPVSEAAPLEDLLRYFAYRRLRGGVSSTMAKYRIAIRGLTKSLERSPLISDLTDENIENVMWQDIERGRSIATANSSRSKLIALANFAFRRRLLHTLPEVPKRRQPKRIPSAWLPAQLKTLFEACQKQEGEICGIPASLWLHVFHSISWNTAERVSAILSARWDNFSFETGYLTIVAEARKGQTEDKQWRLDQVTVALLRHLRAFNPGELILPWPGCVVTFYYMYKAMLRRAGLPHTRRDKTHKMRRSTASYFAAAGGDPVQLLGHADPACTKFYLDPTIVGVKQASDLLPRPEGFLDVLRLPGPVGGAP